jgi:trypsin
MKLFIAALLVASVASSPHIDSRITSGTDAKDGMAKCYVTLVIEGETTGIKTCGGCLLVPEILIVTSASCVFSASDGKASSIKVYPGIKGTSGTEAKNEIVEIYIPPGFDVTKKNSRNDAAIIVYADNFKTVKNAFEGAIPRSGDKKDAYVGQSLVVCGFGNTDNKKSKPKTLQCATLRVVPSAVCEALMAPLAATTADPATTSVAPGPLYEIICTKNIDDKNVCGGDLGAPVFSNQTGTPMLVGVVSFYPDTRPNARCQDGHHVVITHVTAF